MPTRSRATPLPQAASPGPSPNSVSAPLVRSARVHTNALACSVPTHWHTRLPIQTHQAHPGAHTQVPLAGRQAGRRHGTRRPSAPRRRLSACPSTRGSAVVNDAFDGGRICCARSERAPIICFPEGWERPPPCEPRLRSRPRGKLPLGSGVHRLAAGLRVGGLPRSVLGFELLWGSLAGHGVLSPRPCCL